MEYTDLVLLDIKQIDEEAHKKLTGHTNKNILQMAEKLSEMRKPVWIRHVLVPGGSDRDDYLNRLAQFIHTLKNVERVEVLPYHTLGIFKWEKLATLSLGGCTPAIRRTDCQCQKNSGSNLKNDSILKNEETAEEKRILLPFLFFSKTLEFFY